MSRKEEMRRVGDLIRGKLRHEDKIKQYKERIALELGMLLTTKPEKGLRDNYWLAGFVMGDGMLSVSFQTFRRRGHKKGEGPIKSAIEISQKRDYILNQIREEMGGRVNKRREIFVYMATNMDVIRNWINYLDEYRMMGSKGEQYEIFRKVWEMRMSPRAFKRGGKKRV